jgi:hypothetical protein
MIARNLTVTSPSGNAAVFVSISEPRPSGEDFACEITIKGGSFDCRKSAYGVDSMQAMIHAIGMARAIITSSDDFKRGNLFWLEKDSGLDPI